MTFPQYNGLDDLRKRSQLQLGEWRANKSFQDEWFACRKKVYLTTEKKCKKEKKEEGAKREKAVMEFVYVVMRSEEEFSKMFRVERNRLIDQHNRGEAGTASTAGTADREQEGDRVVLDIWDIPTVPSFYLLHKDQAYKGVRVRISMHTPVEKLGKTIWLHQHLQQFSYMVPSYLVTQYVADIYSALRTQQKKGKDKRGPALIDSMHKAHLGYMGKFQEERVKLDNLAKRVKQREEERRMAASSSGEAKAAKAEVTLLIKEEEEELPRPPSPSCLTASLLLEDILSQPSVVPIGEPVSAPKQELREQPIIPFTQWEIFPPHP
eukprot:TRINITY_DN326_c2_g1_i2.p1 TRINITY_DN326_c2_g1~~TRINITY_DN326_c2_g1_i2.p1  ORF type:complete len:332 (+),score=89.97 TRINITY_DN326_c2_g1_i2:32-997(+)